MWIVKCLDLTDILRIYLEIKEKRQKLVCDGFQFKTQIESVYDCNPFSSVATDLWDSLLKDTPAWVPLSVQIIIILKHFNVEFKNELRYENNRNLKFTQWNRFVYVVSLPDGIAFQRFPNCAGCRCWIYYFGQNQSK